LTNQVICATVDFVEVVEVNKTLALQMIDELERLITENSVLRQYVNRIHDNQEIRRKADPTLSPAPTARFLTQGRRGTETLPSLGHQMCAPLRAHIEQDADWERVVQELLLRLAPQEKKVN
jgi:hypothetical protein